jgi:transcriptional regulator with XRE-family HTH domain
MFVGERLRILRLEKKLSQGDIEKRSGLLRAYISRVENGYTVPTLETLARLVRALEVPMYQVLEEDGDPPKATPSLKRKGLNEVLWGDAGKSARYLFKLRRNLGRLNENDLRLILQLAQKMAQRSPHHTSSFPRNPHL